MDDLQALSVLIPPASGDPAVGSPPVESLEHAISEAESPRLLKLLYDRATALQEQMQRNGAALDQLTRIAVIRIRAGRKLGQHLSRTVRRGGRGTRAAGAMPVRGGCSTPLPPGISRTQSSRFQRLAAVPDAVLARYLAGAEQEKSMVSVSGLLRTAGWADERAARGIGAAAGCRIPARVGEAVRRLMDVDLAIGVPAQCVGARHEMPWAAALGDELWGNVVVSADDGARCLASKLTRLRIAKRTTAAILVVPAVTWGGWFVELAQDPWMCCFLTAQQGEDREIVLYLGECRHAFWLVFRDLGLVLGPANAKG